MFLEHEDDAVSAAGDVHENIFENEKIRVLDVHVPLQYKSASHWHPKNMSYVLQSGQLRIVLPDGTIKDVILSEGQVNQGEGMHIVENIGDTEIRIIQIEFKD